MSISQEPPNGDFVAYLEALERQSAARILSKSQVPMAELPHVPGRAATSYLPQAGGDAATPVLNRQQAEELLARLTRTGRVSHAARAAIALVVGLVSLLFWFIADGGAVPFLIGLGLIAWSISRLRGLGPGTHRSEREREQVAQLFGKKPPQA